MLEYFKKKKKKRHLILELLLRPASTYVYQSPLETLQPLAYTSWLWVRKEPLCCLGGLNPVEVV